MRFSFVRNSVILSLCIMIVAARTAQATELTQQAASATREARPKVLEFYANWAEPCQQLKPAMDQARREYANAVEFVSYDVDDPDARAIVEKYEVAPIPTVIFIDQNNEVCGYAVGFSKDGALDKGINKLLGKSTTMVANGK